MFIVCFQAAACGKIEMVNFLLSNGADPLLQDNFGQTAVDEARTNGQSEAVAILTDHIKTTAMPENSDQS